MTATLPTRSPDSAPYTAERSAAPDAGDVLRGARLLHLAVATKNGPLVTPVLYGTGDGRLWFVTRRQVLKARLLARRPDTAWVVQDGERAVAMRGRATLLTATTPHAVLRNSLRIPFGLTSWMKRNPREVVGFVADGVSRPGTVAPQNFVLVSLDPTSTATTRLEWTGSEGPGVALPDELPAGLETLVRQAGPVTVGLETDAGLVAVPGVWDPVEAEVRVPGHLLPGAASTLPACVTLEEPVRDRPTQQRGLVLRGEAALVASGDDVLVRIDARRVTFWDGFATGTLAMPSAA